MPETSGARQQSNIIVDIWASFRAMPGWVQLWVALILVPVNMASLLFLDAPRGALIAVLANIGYLLNLPVMLLDRGFSKRMALPHLVPWTLLVALLVFARPEAMGSYAAYLWVLLIVDAVSLLFDYPDALKWLRGDRGVAGR